MQTNSENTQNPVGTTWQITPGTLADETWRKSIPAQVFLNHFFAIDFHIQQLDDLADLSRFPIFEGFAPTVTDEQRRALEKLLLNCWSAEYALRITPVVNDNHYLQNSLHWTFPQAYYSVLFGVRAFLSVLGETVSNEEAIRRRVGNMVVRGYYPASVGFYASGPMNNYRFNRLPLARRVEGKSDLTLPNREAAAQAEVAQFLKTTRDQRMKALRQAIQKNPKTAFRSLKTGEILQKFGEEQYRQLGRQMGYTTYFDILSRLRISSTNREIERFVDSDIDIRLFHESLVNIVAHVNSVHELYIAKALGLQGYRQLIAKLPVYLQESFLSERLRTVVEPALTQNPPQPLRIAA
ncbi:hypothetical protein [Tellurirhabdus rosea]|uniref:hypothetical protein n=1 Tax=Tellurirhabdus rosea TaxID=2674997 RepID=UPI0022506D9D|nr:hypothetical protein [Tellurirhabdus rosea]